MTYFFPQTKPCYGLQSLPLSKPGYATLPTSHCIGAMIQKPVNPCKNKKKTRMKPYIWIIWEDIEKALLY